MLTKTQTDVLRKLLPRSRGDVDRLPYTPAFDHTVLSFEHSTHCQLSRAELWRAILKVSKSGTRATARPFLEKSVKLLRRAISDFNSFEISARENSVIVFLHWSHEMLLKAALLQRGRKIDDAAKPHHSISFSTCVNWGLTVEGVRFLTNEDAQMLRAINSLRGEEYHANVELDEAELYIYARATVDIFDRILNNVFGSTLSDVLPVRVLPISTIALQDILVLLDRKSSQILSLLKAGETRRAQAATRSLLVLEKSVAGEEDPSVSANDVAATVARLRRGTDVQSCFPLVSGIELSAPGSGPQFSLSIRGKQNLQVGAVVAAEGDSVVAYRELDARNTFPLTLKKLAEKCGISTRLLTAVIRELKLKDRQDCCRLQGPATSATLVTGYSAKAIEVVKDFLNMYTGDLKQLVRRHLQRTMRLS